MRMDKYSCTKRSVLGYKSFFSLIALLLFPLLFQQSFAQVTVVLDKVPENTPQGDSIYIVGSFNNWNPADRNYILNKRGGSYYITLPAGVQSFQFKFTRGGWPTAEGTTGGKPIANRVYTLEKGAKDTLRTQIKGWEDLPFLSRVSFHLLEVPKNTPHDAAIYVAGNFNDWNPADSHYKLDLQADSTYKLTIPTDLDTLLYKFTRGTWPSVESRANGRAVFNHRFIRKNAAHAVIQTEVAAWEDLVIGSITIYALILLMAIVQGFFLIIAINGLQHKNKKANAVLSLLIFLLSLALIGRLASYQSVVYNFQPKLLLLSDIIYFLFGPLFYLYMLRLLTVREKSKTKEWLHFLPALLQLILYLPLLFQDRTSFITNIREQSYSSFFAVVGFAALLYNFFYWIRCYKLLRKYQEDVAHTHSFEENLSYLSTFIKLMAVCLSLWAFSYLVYPISYMFGYDPLPISELSLDIMWVVISVLTYFLGYYAMAQPEIFTQLQDEDVFVSEKQKEVILPDENLIKMKEELSKLMLKQKPYRNPKLSLQELAEMMDTNLHTISRLINEGYDKNFYDFINEYRIEDFKDLITKEQYKNQTFLALALEVGFSSKTTFYRAFKKSTGETPRKYFSLVHERDFEDEE